MSLYRVIEAGYRRGGRRLSTHIAPLFQETTPTQQETFSENEEDIIEQKRNKSRLKQWHFAKYHSQIQELTDDEEQVLSLRFQRKLYGRYGAISGISSAKLWPSKEELATQKERESITYPHTVQEMINIAKEQKKQEEKLLKERQEDLVRKVAKLKEWKMEVNRRVAKQEKEAQEAKEKKERLIEEVRSILGYRIDPKDERFKEALLKKEMEDKKASKAAKKLARQQRLIERLTKVSAEVPSAGRSSTDDEPNRDPPSNTSGSPEV